MKKIKNYLFAVGGILLIAVGLGLVKGIPEPAGLLRALPYLCIGIGCGSFGYGMGELVTHRVLKNDPELARQMEIDSKDERNIMLSGLAKARAYDLMTYVFGALMIAFALMNVEISAVLLLVAAYLFVEGYSIYYRIKLEKEM